MVLFQGSLSRILGEEGIPRHYDLEEFDRDMMALEELS